MAENKDILFDTEARRGLKDGVDKLAKAVAATFGAAGRNVAYTDGLGRRKVTKDGVTVANQVMLSDPLENMGADLVKEVAMRTGDTVGDGTTTATILAQAIINEGYRIIAAGANPIDVKRGIDKAVAAVVKYLDKVAIPVNDATTIKHIATISANNDSTFGELISEAFDKTGKHGVIRVERSKNEHTRIEVINGMKLERGLASAYFVTNPEKEETVFDNPLILLYDGKIESFKEMKGILEQVVLQNRPIVVIASEFDGHVLETLAVNNVKGLIRIAAIKSPDFGDNQKEIMNDLAAFTSATLCSESIGLSIDKIEPAHLGTASQVIMTKDSTIIVDGYADPEAMKQRVELIEKKLSETEAPRIKEYLLKRLANINGGIALLHVGATSEVELGEKIDRADDAVGATRAAIEEGIVAGGGVTLLRAKKFLDKLKPRNEDEGYGIKIISKAVEAPIRIIVGNSGAEGSVVIDKVLNSNLNTGYNVKTGEYTNMLKAGIIDPKKVTRVALESAASVAGMILITECVLLNSHG